MLDRRLLAWAVVAVATSGCGGGRAAGVGVGAAPDSTYDLVIANGRVVDGAGNAWFNGDVAIRGDRIARIVRRGQQAPLMARRTIDATGMVVAPGFIDIQAGGNYVSGDGRDVSKGTQGITTEIFGEAYTGAPISDLSPVDMTPAGGPAGRGFTGPRACLSCVHGM